MIAPWVLLVVLSAAGSGAYATAALMSPGTLQEYPVLVGLGWSVLALLGGAARTLLRMSHSAETGKPIVNPRLMILSDLAMAFVAGAMGYSVASHYGLPSSAQFGVMPFCGWMGAEGVAWVAERFRRNVLPPNV
jgi:hypothetical protein